MKETAAGKCRESSGLKEKRNTPCTPAHLPSCLSRLQTVAAPAQLRQRSRLKAGDEGKDGESERGDDARLARACSTDVSVRRKRSNRHNSSNSS